MRLGLHLHLFYPDIAAELVDRVAALGPIDAIVTHSAPLAPDVAASLDLLPGDVERIAVPNRGWDIAPLLAILPRALARGWEAIGHLHTKQGASGYAAEWREIAYEGTIADRALIERLRAAFAGDRSLLLGGPASLYKSAASHRFGNADLLARLAPALVAPAFPPADWGFFAGSFFWARTDLLERVATLAAFVEADAGRDGTLAHALERLVGLAPVATGGRIALVGEDGALNIVAAPGRPSHEPIVRTLVDRAERAAAPPDARLSALIAARNPLADYLRHGRDSDALDPNPYFSSSWYNRIHADIAAAGMHPFVHYVRHGAEEGRATGPLFDGAFYRRRYGDAPGDPLRHFLEKGAAAGRVAIPITTSEDDTRQASTFHRQFDVARETTFLREMVDLPADVVARARDTLVSVIMPAWNREGTIGAAIRSVLAQTHRRLELIVVDDGSTDGTVAAVEPFLADARVRLVRAGHGGVSAARNAGLGHATGSLVAYLDSDNRWAGWFLEVMTRFMAARGLEAAYSGIALRDDLGHLTGYRGGPFDWDACLEQNFVDLNAFVHARAVLGDVGGFDPNLRRMVDWDLILRIGRGREVGYAPFVGCDYHDGQDDRGRITVREPAAFQKLVRLKNKLGLETGSPDFAAAVKLSVAIKIAAPFTEREEWGDWHFAGALAAAIERLGHTAHVDCREHWSGRALADEDVAIVLRGLLPYAPRQGQIGFLWNISHPDQVPFEEYERFSHVHVASESHAAWLRHLVAVPVTPLLQATDPTRFGPADATEPGPELLFVGNSRGVDRDIVRWAIEAGLSPAIHGNGWAGRVPDALLRTTNTDNRELGRLYASAGSVLNDHWPSMRAFGYLSNRLFDIAATGGRAISDAVPSMRQVFGDAVAEVDGPAALRRALERDGPSAAGRLALAGRIARDHGFDVRARTLMTDALALLGLPPPAALVPAPKPDKLRVHAMVAWGRAAPQSPAYIRLIGPLTDDAVAGRVALTVGRGDEPVPECDVCIVQRTAVASVEAADVLLARLARMGAALVTDIDDAFREIGPDHPEAATYRPLSAVLDRLVAAAAENWFSTAEVARLYAPVSSQQVVVPNAIDPRLWRNWRQPTAAPFAGGPSRLLYMGTHTHGHDLALIRPALDGLWQERPGAFELTVIGIDPDIAPAPWLRRLAPPGADAVYPRFVRWLRDQGPFDAGLAPLVDTAFARAKSDMKLLDYSALGLAAIVSDGPAYAIDPVLRAHAFVAAADQWPERLRELLDDGDRARHMAAGAHAHTWQRRSARDAGLLLLDRLEALVR